MTGILCQRVKLLRCVFTVDTWQCFTLLLDIVRKLREKQNFVQRRLCSLRTGYLHCTFYWLLFSELNKNPVEGFSAGLIDDNDIYRWEVLIIGPPDTL